MTIFSFKISKKMYNYKRFATKSFYGGSYDFNGKKSCKTVQ